MKALICMFVFMGFIFTSSAQDSGVVMNQDTTPQQKADTIQLIRTDTMQSPKTDTVALKGFKKLWKKITGPSPPPKKGKLYFYPVPLISASPTVGFLFGVGAGGSIFLADPKDTRISTIQLGAAYTIKNQIYINAQTSIYLSHDDWIIYGDWRFYISSIPDFALGTGPATDDLASNGARYNDNPYAKQDTDVRLLYYDYLRLYETVLRRVVDKFYLGIAYDMDYYTRIKDPESNLYASPPVTSNYYAYNVKHGFNQGGSVLSGVSANAIYDTRDNQNNPYAGRYAFVSFRYNPVFFGSNKNSSTLWVEYRDYVNIGHNHHNILAFWAYGDFVTSGAVPYMNLPSCGNDQFSRGGEAYINGRFKGEDYLFGEIEYRRHIWGFKNLPDWLGFTVFVNMNTANSKEDNIRLFKFVAPACGGGLRFNISNDARSNVCVDYAVGCYGSQGVYVRFNEAF